MSGIKISAVRPVSGQVYDLRRIFQLDLRDTPSLGFYHKPPVKREVDHYRDSDDVQWGEMPQVVQTSHCTEEQLLAMPGWAKSQWRYIRTTHEWIPVFKYAGTQPITELVDMEPWNDNYARTEEPRCWWVTPKGLPREQYCDEHGNERF